MAYSVNGEKEKNKDLFMNHDTQIERFITFNHIFGGSKVMKEIGEIIKDVAVTDIPILITGESGTGKTLIAKVIHKISNRSKYPFVTVSCVNIPSELLESELFGYEKGAFTGAYQSKPGRIEFANKGTLFLDEIGDMPITIQGKLLRVLQNHEFTRLGANKDIKVNVRFISATNKNLSLLIEDNKFREDLYFRINVMKIRIPPLRERPEEILKLVNYFQKRFCEEYSRKPKDISPYCIELMERYHWPGNIRELENAVKRLVVLGETPVIEELQHLIDVHESETANNSNSKPIVPYDEGEDNIDVDSDKMIYDLKKIGKMASANAEKKIIKKVLHEERWNKKRAAKRLSISYKALLYKIKELGLE